MNSTCSDCGGSCCSFRTMGICFTSMEASVEETLSKHNPEQLLRSDGKVPNMRFFVRNGGLEFDCQHRSPAGKCRIYKKRPDMCRDFRCQALKGLITVDQLKANHPPVPGPQGKEVTKEVVAYLKSLS